MSTRSTPPHHWRPFVVAAALATLGVAAFAVILGFQLGGATFVTNLDDIGEAIAALIAALACAWAARRSEGQFRRSWALLAASAASWCVGEVIWSIYEVGFGLVVPAPSLADAGFLVAIPLAIVGILSFFTAPRGTSERVRLWLDGLNIVLALTFTAWALGLKQVFLSPGSLTERSFALAYPIGDILIGTILILAIRRATHHQQGRMLLLLGGLAAITFSDSLFAYMNATGTLIAMFDTGWVAGYLIIALAALWPPAQKDTAADRGPIDLWQVALPWLVVLAAAASAVVVLIRGERNDEFETLLAVGMGVVMIVNQVLIYRDFMTMLANTRRSEAVLSEVVGRAPIGIARTDANFKIIDANPGLGELLHERPEDLVGTIIGKYISVEAQLPVFEKLGALATGEAGTVGGECPVVRADGSQVWSHWSSTAVKNVIGQIDYYLAMLEDVDSRHKADEAAKSSLATLERLNRLKTQFLHSMSHEFRTALVGIQGFSEFMRDTDDLNINDARAFASDIYSNAARLDGMVTEMLDLDRVEAGRASLRVEPVDLNAIIKREIEDARRGVDGIVLIANLEPSLEVVAGDADRLSEVVKTLLRNAIRYSPDGGQIVVSSRMREGQAEVAVSDQGVGTRADFDNRLFGEEDLYANNPIRKVVGTGLGLGIARQIVEMHGGRFWVNRLEEKGSEFHFAIPALSPHQAVTATAAPSVKVA